MKINLFNRDGAKLILNKTDKEVAPEVYVWELIVDFKHEYVLKYCRYIFDENNRSNICAIDPSGGPFLSVGDKFGKYQIVKINSVKNIWLRERDNNNEKYSK